MNQASASSTKDHLTVEETRPSEAGTATHGVAGGRTTDVAHLRKKGAVGMRKEVMVVGAEAETETETTTETTIEMATEIGAVAGDGAKTDHNATVDEASVRQRVGRTGEQIEAISVLPVTMNDLPTVESGISRTGRNAISRMDWVIGATAMAQALAAGGRTALDLADGRIRAALAGAMRLVNLVLDASMDPSRVIGKSQRV